MKLHQMIGELNPNPRSIEEFHGETRKREFDNMSHEDACSILETITAINGLQDNLHKVKLIEKEMEDEKAAEENRILDTNRHHFKNIHFKSILTRHEYKSSTNKKACCPSSILLLGKRCLITPSHRRGR
jgi:hypothetical protein